MLGDKIMIMIKIKIKIMRERTEGSSLFPCKSVQSVSTLHRLNQLQKGFSVVCFPMRRLWEIA